MELKYFLLILLKCASGITGEPFAGISQGLPAYNLNVISVVSIRVNNLHECGGSIVSPYWVLTAAHCLREDKPYSILYGTLRSYNGLNAPPLRTRIVVYKMLYPLYNYQNIQYDVGLAMVDTAFKFNQRVQSVQLPPRNYVIQTGQRAQFLGWGLNSQNDRRVPSILRKLSMPVFIKPDCPFAQLFRPNEFCAGRQYCSACPGDSGSALLLGNMQIGINSWSYHPCEDGPSAFQDVAQYVDWINHIIF